MRNVHVIQLTNGGTATVDKADETLVAGFNWHRSPKGYIYADRNRLRIALHRLIAGAGEGELVDHQNGDPSDNRTCNLRIASSSQNGANRGADRRRAGKTSHFKGVSWSKTKNRWLVYVHFQGRTRYVGRSLDETEAARMYNAAARQIWGEFARLNDVE